MDLWESLPTDVLLVIFLSLEPTAVIRCAGVCKPWRRAMIGNASILGPHLDRFRPSLLLGVFHNCRTAAFLRRMPGPFQSALPWNNGGDNEAATAYSLIPASSASSSGVDRGLYKELLCSRDGFILLMARSGRDTSLCLCNPMTGDCMFLPSAVKKPRGRHSNYFLLTSYDNDDVSPSCTGNKLAARILAVHSRTRYKYNDFELVFKFKARALSYQILSMTGDNAGKWGSVKRSVGELEEGLCVWMQRCTTMVCGDAVYWLAGPEDNITCVLALNVCSGRTWTTELPKQCHFRIDSPVLAILATSSDGRLSFMQSFGWGPKIKVWVLTDDAGWTLNLTIPIGTESLIAGGRVPYLTWLGAFCPRSQCLVVTKSKKELLIDLGSGSSYPPVMCIGNYEGGSDVCPYEIDCSATYISKLKHL